MSFHPLFIDTDRGEPVASATDSTVADLPTFTQGDILTLHITLLGGFSRISPYTPIPVSGLTLEVAIGEKIGNETVYYASQFTWTPSSDLAQPYFSGDLALNTSEITTLIGGNPTAKAFFEVKIIEDGLPWTVLSKQVEVNAAVIKDGGTSPLVSPTPLTAEVANATYLQRRIPCSITNPLVLVDEATGAETAIWPNNDGTISTALLS